MKTIITLACAASALFANAALATPRIHLYHDVIVASGPDWKTVAHRDGRVVTTGDADAAAESGVEIDVYGNAVVVSYADKRAILHRDGRMATAKTGRLAAATMDEAVDSSAPMVVRHPNATVVYDGETRTVYPVTGR